MQKKAFTLIEILVVITIIGFLAIGSINLLSKNTSDRQKLDIFLSKITGKIDTVRNYAIVGKGIGVNLITPTYYKIDFATGNYMESFVDLSGTETGYLDLTIKPFDTNYKLKSIECSSLDGTSTGSINLVSIKYQGSNTSMSGCSDTYQKIVDLKFNYNGANSILRINTISGVIEKINN